MQKSARALTPPTPSEHDAPRNTGACPSDASSCQLLFFRQRDLASLLRGASGRDREGIVACDRLRAWKHRCHAQPRCDPISTTICASSHGSQPKQETLLASASSSYSRPRIKQTKKRGKGETQNTSNIPQSNDATTPLERCASSSSGDGGRIRGSTSINSILSLI